MPKSKATKYYVKQLKSGKYKRRVHDGRTGRIVRWEDVPELIPPKGKIKILEWVRYYEYRKGDLAYELRNFEMRLRLPDGYTLNEVESMMDDIMDELIYNPETGEPTHEFFTKHMQKMGEDVIEYTDEEYIKWKVIDNARKHLKYPKDVEWGEHEERE